MKKSGSFLFKTTCFFLAGYMTTKLVQRYFHNLDMSSIAIKAFLEDLNDRYPTFTFCLEDKEYGDIFNFDYLYNRGLLPWNYQRELRGTHTATLPGVVQVSFDGALKSPLDMIWDFKTKTRNGTMLTHWFDQRTRLNVPDTNFTEGAKKNMRVYVP